MYKYKYKYEYEYTNRVETCIYHYVMRFTDSRFFVSFLNSNRLYLMQDTTKDTFEWCLTHADSTSFAELEKVLSVYAHQSGVVTLNAAYAIEARADSPLACIRYSPAQDTDNHTLFQFAYQLPAQWMHTLMHTAETTSAHLGWTIVLDVAIDPYPESIYKASVCMLSCGVWEVVQDTDIFWENAVLKIPIDAASVCTAVSVHRNHSTGSTSTSNTKTAPLFALALSRVDMGQFPSPHEITIHAFRMTERDIRAEEEEQKRNTQKALSKQTHILTSIRTADQLRQPVAIVTRDIFETMCAGSHAILQFSIQGVYQNLSNLRVRFQPVSAQSAVVLSPTTYVGHVDASANTFALATNHIFATDVDSIELYFDVSHSDGLEIDITDLKLMPIAMQSQVTKLYNEYETDSVGFHTIDGIKKELRDIKHIADIIKKSEGPSGPAGKRGPKGERGEPLRFADLHATQKEEVRGARGVPGPRGRAMVFEDLTADQRVLLRGETGCKGDAGKDGDQGPPGPIGRPFTFNDLTDTQTALLRGERGVKGAQGDALLFEELTTAQKKCLQGEKGERGYKGDTGERGDRGRVGPTGPIGNEGKHGPRGLPGVPGSKGDPGESGERGANGQDGRAAVIKTSFMSVELLRDYVHKSLHLMPNTYYIIDHPSNTEDHGKLFSYTGSLDLEMTVCCSYLENIRAVLNEYNVIVRTTVQTDSDEWKIMVTVQSDDICVHHLRRGLENSISQSGYLVKDSIVTEDALQLVGRLCGVQGHTGERGEQGDSGKSMLGLRLDFIGTDASRMKLREPEPNAIFLQVKPSKTHEAGFYIFEHANNRWTLLQAVDVEDSFMQWMAQYVDNPNQESIPLVLSMFATTQKQMEGHYNNLRHELQDYRNTNEKWKKYQFEHWKSMGNSQYQQFNTQLSENSNLMENVVQQVNTLSDKTVSKDELTVLRKLVDKQNQKVERQYRSARESLAEFTERQTVDKSVFEQEQETVQSKLRDLDMSTLRMLKIIQYLKTAPWTKSVKVLAHENDQLALLHADFAEQQRKTNKDLRKHIEQEFPETIKALQVELHQMVDKMSTNTIALDRNFAEWSDQYDKRLLTQASEHTDSTAQLHKHIQNNIDKMKLEIVSTNAKTLFGTKQEFLEKYNDVRETIYAHEQDVKKTHLTLTKRIETVDAKCETLVKKQIQQVESQLNTKTSELLTTLSKKIEQTVKDTNSKLLQTVDALQKERKETDSKQLQTVHDLQAGLTETQTDLTTLEAKWYAKLDAQKDAGIHSLTSQLERCRADTFKQIKESNTQSADSVSALHTELKQQHTQHLYDAKGATKKINDVETRLCEDMDRKLSATKTYTDERSREFEQKYNNAVQTLTTDTQSIDARCSAIDYTLKARLESVEEHIQQLFTEGQQQCETMVDKNKKDSLSSVESLRQDTTAQYQQVQQSMLSQQKRNDTTLHDTFQNQNTQLDRLEAGLLETKRANETAQQKWTQYEHAHIRQLDLLKKEFQLLVHNAVTDLKKQNGALFKELQDTKRELHTQLETKHKETLSESSANTTAVDRKLQETHTAIREHTNQQLASIRTTVEGVCKHVNQFATDQTTHRQQYDQKLQNVVQLLEKTFVEMMSES